MKSKGPHCGPFEGLQIFLPDLLTNRYALTNN